MTTKGKTAKAKPAKKRTLGAVIAKVAKPAAHRHNWRKDGTCRCGATRFAPPIPNPWLIGAIVRVRPDAGPFDRNKEGVIEDVHDGENAHVVKVFLRDGRQIEFLSTQLELV